VSDVENPNDCCHLNAVLYMVFSWNWLRGTFYLIFPTHPSNSKTFGLSSFDCGWIRTPLSLNQYWTFSSPSQSTMSFRYTGGLISSGASLFSYLLEEIAHIIHTADEGQLQCLTIEFALPADWWVW
jgi:hypothetical protein